MVLLPWPSLNNLFHTVWIYLVGIKNKLVY